MCREFGFRSQVLALPMALFVALPLTGIQVNYAGAIATLASAAMMIVLLLIRGGASRLPAALSSM